MQKRKIGFLMGGAVGIKSVYVLACMCVCVCVCVCACERACLHLRMCSKIFILITVRK
jgi:hypothetical protein